MGPRRCRTPVSQAAEGTAGEEAAAPLLAGRPGQAGPPAGAQENCGGGGSAGAVSAGTTPKSGSAPILKCPTQFPLILWHPYARHYYFCMMTEAEQDKWQAVLQDCVRHCNNGEWAPGPWRWGEGHPPGCALGGDTYWLSVA